MSEAMTGQIENRILAVGASPRKGGNSDLLLEQFAAGAAGSGVDTEIVQLRDLQFSPCVGCEQCRTTKSCTRFDDDMCPLYPKLVAARGLILISPVHNYNLTAWMKAFIDRLYCFYDFEEPRPGPWGSRLAGQGRQALVAAVCEQVGRKDMGFTLEALQMPLEALGYRVHEPFPVLGLFGRGAVAKEAPVLAGAEAAGARLACALQSPAA